MSFNIFLLIFQPDLFPLYFTTQDKYLIREKSNWVWAHAVWTNSCVSSDNTKSRLALEKL